MPTAPSQLARDAAMRRLAELHPDDWSRLLIEERVARGLAPEPQRGLLPVERVPAPKLLEAMSSRHMAPALGISSAVWRAWITKGVPVGHEGAVAAACGLPVDVLWPPAAEDRPKLRSIKPPKVAGRHKCRCGNAFVTRDELARHRLELDHYDEEDAVS